MCVIQWIGSYFVQTTIKQSRQVCLSDHRRIFKASVFFQTTIFSTLLCSFLFYSSINGGWQNHLVKHSMEMWNSYLPRISYAFMWWFKSVDCLKYSMVVWQKYLPQTLYVSWKITCLKNAIICMLVWKGWLSFICFGSLIKIPPQWFYAFMWWFRGFDCLRHSMIDWITLTPLHLP